MTTKSEGQMIRLRPVAKKDLEFCRALRNENRYACFYQKEISKKEQKKWWGLYCSEPGELFVVEKRVGFRYARIGCVGYKIRDDFVDLYNVMLLHKWRGQGIVPLAIGMLKTVLPDECKWMPIGVYVLRSNYDEYKWYLRNGFLVVSESDTYYLMYMKDNQ